MEKSQYNLCLEVLNRLNNVGILKDIILVGSWCQLLYKDYFKSRKYMISLTTRDMDLLVPEPKLLKVNTDVPERGKGTDKPYSLPQLGLNAQALRYLDFLSQNTIDLNIDSLPVRLPHPANFALHKLLILKKRANREKRAKDKEAAIRILTALLDCNKYTDIRKQLTDVTERRIFEVLQY